MRGARPRWSRTPAHRQMRNQLADCACFVRSVARVPDGILLTNYHVISGGSGIIAKTPTGAVYILKSVVSYSEAHDVAELQFLTTDAPYLTLGHSSGAVEGQRVLVIGNPVGLEGTVSEGIISAFRAGRTLIQITAPISPGSSGSPVLD